MFSRMQRHTMKNLLSSTVYKRFLHSKNRPYNISNHKIFVDPFDNFKEKDLKPFLDPKYYMLFKLDNSKFEMKVEMLDITSDYNVKKDSKCDLDQNNIFDFNFNEEEKTITIEPKPDVELGFPEKLDRRLQIVLKTTNAEHLEIQLRNCELKIHNSTHFKHELGGSYSTIAPPVVDVNPKIPTPIDLNPNFKTLTFNFNKSEVALEKFDHKFVNTEYTYNFKISNFSSVNIKKFFIYQMNCEIEGSQLFIDKMFGYKYSGDESFRKNMIKLNSAMSFIQIQNFINCGEFDFNSVSRNEIETLPQNNNLIINNFASNKFNIQLSNNDRVNLNLYDVFDNSNLVFNHENGTIRIHPFLIIALNIYQVFTQRFLPLYLFGRDGYMFCPTVVINTNKELKKRNIIGFEMIKFRDSYLMQILFVIFAYFVIKILTVEETIHKNYSEYSYYQLFFKHTLEKYIYSKVKKDS